MLFLVPLVAGLALSPSEERSFVAWMREHRYVFTGTEYFLRLGIFLANSRRIAEFNRGTATFSVALNPFAHLTSAEWAQLFPPVQARPSAAAQKATTASAPASLDWRDNGVVTPIKDQGSCGSCWAFSTVAVLESLWARAGNELVPFSEQALINCCSDCLGCGGGDPTLALNMIIRDWHGKLPRESAYPYQGFQGPCQGVQVELGNVTSWGAIPFADENDMKEKCAAYGPVSALQKSNLWSYVFYSGGIYREEQCSQLDFDHAVTVIGYGTEGGQDYWLIKNSMGAAWGEDGYMRLARNAGNMCGIASRSVYVK